MLNARNAGLRRHNGEIVVEAAWPAIVDRDTYDAVVALLGDPDRLIARAPGRKYLLNGIALCGKCGHTLGSTVPSASRGPRYHCKNCFGVTRKVADVDNFVLSVATERLSRDDALLLLDRADRPDLAALRAEANTLRLRQEQMAEAVADGGVTVAQLRAFNERVAKQLADVDAKLVDSSKSRVLDGLIGPTRDAVRRRLDALGLDRQRAVVDLLVTVTVQPGQTRGKFRPDLVPIKWKD